MKHKKTFLAALLAGAMLLSACGGAPSSTGTGASASTAASSSSSEAAGVPNADLLVSVWGGPHADVQKSVVQSYPNGIVTIDDVDFGNLQAKQLTSFGAQAGSGNYDVVWLDSKWVGQYVEAGYLLPLDEYIDKLGVDTSMYAAGLCAEPDFVLRHAGV